MKTEMTKTIPVMMLHRRIVNATSDGKHKEFRYVNVPVEQECKCFCVEHDGKEKTFYIPLKRMSENSNPLCHIYNENGYTINAIWQHGHYGSMEHIEPALFNWRSQTFVSRSLYCNGRVKDSFKYMRKVLF